MNQHQQQGDGTADGYGYGAGGAGGKSSKARKHAGGRNSTPYARPATGRHAAAGPSNAAALGSAKANGGQATSAGPGELARPLKNNGWWGALSSIASGAAHLVTTPLSFFKSDPRPENEKQDADVKENGDSEVGPSGRARQPEREDSEEEPQAAGVRSVDLSELIKHSMDGVVLSEEECEKECERIRQFLKSKTKGKRPLGSVRRPDARSAEETPHEPLERQGFQSQSNLKPDAVGRADPTQEHPDVDANGSLEEQEQGRSRGMELAYSEGRSLRATGRTQDEESPVKVALKFMNQARLPAQSADLSPDSNKSFSFPRLDNSREMDRRFTGSGLQGFAEEGGGHYRTPAPRRGSITSRPYTLQQRAGSVEIGEDFGTRWTPVRAPLSGGREMLKRRVSEVADGWQTESLRRIRQRGLEDVEGSVQRRSFRHAVQATPAPSLRPPASSFTPAPSQTFTPGTSGRAPQTGRRLPSLPPASQPPSSALRGSMVAGAERALSVRQEGRGSGAGGQLPSLRRTEMSKTASKIFETLDMMLSPRKLVGANLSPEVLHDMNLNERARLTQSTLDALPPVDSLRASPGRESPPALPSSEAFPPSTSADYQAASASAERAMGGTPGQKSTKAVEGSKEAEREDREREKTAAEREERGPSTLEERREQPTTEQTGRERGAKRGKVFRAPEPGEDEEGGAVGVSIFPTSQPAAVKSIFTAPATTAPAATLFTGMAPVMSASALSGGTPPAFTFSESKVAKESFQGLKEGADLKAPAGLPEFGFKAQSDFSFSPLAAEKEKPAPAPPSVTTTSAPLFGGSFGGFTAQPPESAPATPSFGTAANASAPAKAFAFMASVPAVQPGAPSLFASAPATGSAVTGSSGKRKAESDANGVEEAKEGGQKEAAPAAEDSGLMGFLKTRKSGTTEGGASRAETAPSQPLAFGQGAGIFGGGAPPVSAPAPTAAFGGVFSAGRLGPKADEKTSAAVESNGNKESATPSTSALPASEAPAKPSGFASILPTTAAPAVSTTPAAASSSAPSFFAFGQPPALAPSTSAAPETVKPLTFGTLTSASTSAAPALAFGVAKSFETPLVNPFGAPKPAETSAAFTFGGAKPAEPSSAAPATSTTAPVFGGTGSTFTGVVFGGQSTPAFGSNPAPAFGSSAVSAPIFGNASSTSAASTPSFTGFGTTPPALFGAQASAPASSAPFSFTAAATPSGTSAVFAFGGQNTAAASSAAPVFPGFGAAAAAPVFGGATANGTVSNGPPSPGSAMDDSGMAEEPAQPAQLAPPAVPLFGQQPQSVAPQPGAFGFSQQSPFPAAANPFQQPQQPNAAFGAGQPAANPFGAGTQSFGGFNSGQGAGFSVGSMGGDDKSGRVIRKAKRPAGAKKR
ncbi:hypothetical protein KFL_001360230 [Klebsormidium nitens]|uniref:Nuclear pore complex protein n=1 Tax=Klebsormidium nitens TaxID=105231 RepID=A0A1Y1I309_KLENI|nr:hypothetical protein KFL_001360230 [Klebsormidium nitens]|eukprot:GAQ83126.1 hypothetical protein KFL_001360230 [Klebsormidium nitens]